MKFFDWLFSLFESMIVFAGSDEYRERMKDYGYESDIEVTEQDVAEYEKKFLDAHNLKV